MKFVFIVELNGDKAKDVVEKQADAVLHDVGAIMFSKIAGHTIADRFSYVSGATLELATFKP